jgi:hypothetical protein
MKKTFISILLLLSFSASAYDFLPDPKLTPGKSSEHSLKEICSNGYPARSRNVSDATKTKIYKLYNVDKTKCRGGCKIDHLIPLSIGGSNDTENLWPHEYNQFWSVYKKTRLEVRLRREVCSGQLPITEARACVASDWTACYNRFYPN